MATPRRIVVGTAGHIDHGKSLLVRALTGIDPDRLKEEQERGITIDLGFAHMSYEDDTCVSFVDVPGHERFVRNMLAGVGGIDLVLLVVAADESIKPQTREHFEICRLLHIHAGIVVLTKADLVGTEILDLVRMEVRELVAGSFLESAPVLAVSARTGLGLDALRQALRDAAHAAPMPESSGLPRLPIDRAFSIKGFGTVVTGTLVGGSLQRGQEITILPEGHAARIRGLEVHGRPVSRAEAGQRVAANLQAIESGAIVRGDVLTLPGILEPSHLLDVVIESLPSANMPLRDLTRVGFHLLSAESSARVKIVGGGAIEPGDSRFAQLRSERPMVALPGDRFILRRHSPSMTIAGGTILHNAPPKLRGRAPEVKGRYERLAASSAAARLLVLVDEAGARGVDAPSLRSRTGVDPDQASNMLSPLLKSGEVLALPTVPRRYLSGAVAERLRCGILKLLESYHRREPLREGLAREEIRTRLFSESHPEVFRCLLADLAAEGHVRIDRDRAALAAHRVAPSAQEIGLIERMESAFRAGGTNPPDLSEIARNLQVDHRDLEKLLHLLLSNGRLTRIPDGKIFHAEAIDNLKRSLWSRREREASIDIAAFKDLAGTSRKNAIPLLEHLDQIRVTRREGSRRVILPPPPAPDAAN